MALNNKIFGVGFEPNFHLSMQARRIVKQLGKYPKSTLGVGYRTDDLLIHSNQEHYTDMARKRGFTIHQSFAKNVNFKQKYDGATYYAIMEHLVYPYKLFNKLPNLLNGSRLFIVMIPTFECLKEYFLPSINCIWRMYVPSMHLNFYSQKYLDNYFQNTGLFLADKYYTYGGIFNPFRKKSLESYFQ